MRLLHKETLEFEWFLDSQRPPYLILSHCWRGPETTLQAFNQEKYLPPDQQTPGTAKVLRFCKEVGNETPRFVWVDTVCIDKTSSAELQEAINSMYKWYQHAQSCYAYLDDVQVDSGCEDAQLQQEVVREIQKSRWWTRGWTLQELIAPVKLCFFDRNWNTLASRNDFADEIAQSTGIQADCLMGHYSKPRTVPVAKRMSWMGHRQTSRVEDQAYCLMGLFGIHMTMLYGEGGNAFLRLQKTILEEIDDESILLWKVTDEASDQSGIHSWPSVLAPEPWYFNWAGSSSIELERAFDREPIRMTTRGVEMELYDTRDSQAYFNLNVPLNCLVNGKRAGIRLAAPNEVMSGINPAAGRDRNRIYIDQIALWEETQYRCPPSVQETYAAGLLADMSGYRNEYEVPYEAQYVRFKVYIRHLRLQTRHQDRKGLIRRPHAA